MNLPSSLRNARMPNVRQMRDNIKEQGANGFVLAAWLLSSLLAFIVPVIKWNVERNKYYNYAGQYNEYEQQQQQYEQQANGNYNNGDGNYGGYNICSWYDIKCRYKMRRYYQNYGGNGEGGGGSNDQMQMRAMLPDWYFFFGGNVEEDERQREEMGLGQNDGSMKFVYICTVIMFAILAVYGFRSMYSGKDCAGLIMALLIFGQFSLMNLLTTVQGTIETDNRFFEDSVYGWFGQWSVLVAYTDFWMFLHCIIFAAFLGIMRFWEQSKKRKAEAQDASALEMGYIQEEDPISEDRDGALA